MGTTNAAAAVIGIIGIGNQIMADEGVGVQALRAMKEGETGGPVRLVDGGTDPWSALAEVGGCTHLIVLDAVQGGQNPGSIYRLTLHEVESSDTMMSLHGTSLFHLLHYEELLGNGFESVTILGMEPATVEPGRGLSGACRKALPRYLRALEDEIMALQGHGDGSS